MAKKSYQLEDGGYIRIINVVFDELARIPFVGCELQVAMIVIRKTWGFNKTEDAISISQFVEATSRPKNTVIRALKSLQDANILIKTKQGSARGVCSSWKINKYTDQWKPYPPVGIDGTRTIPTHGTRTIPTHGSELYPRAGHTKDNIKNNKDIASPYSEIINIMYSYEPCDEDGNPKKSRGKKLGRKQNAEIIKLAFYFEEKSAVVTGVRPDLTRAYFIIKQAMSRHNLTVEDMKNLFGYFLRSKLPIEKKASLALVCSSAYITEWKIYLKNKPVTQIEAAEGIRL